MSSVKNMVVYLVCTEHSVDFVGIVPEISTNCTYDVLPEVFYLKSFSYFFLPFFSSLVESP